jgi:hypothetical protein
MHKLSLGDFIQGQGITFHKKLDSNKIYKVMDIVEHNGVMYYVFTKGKQGKKAHVAHRVESIDYTIESTSLFNNLNGIRVLTKKGI